MPDLAQAHILIAPNGRGAYCAYRVFNTAWGFGATYLDHLSLPSGRLLSTRRIDPGAVLAIGLDDAGAHLAVVDARTITVFDAHSVRRLSSVAIAPPPVAPSAAAISPDGQTVAIGSKAGAISFIHAATGGARPGLGPKAGPVVNLAYSPDGRTLASVANTTPHLGPTLRDTPRGPDRPGRTGGGVAFSPSGQ